MPSGIVPAALSDREKERKRERGGGRERLPLVSSPDPSIRVSKVKKRMKACGRGRLSTPLERGCVLNGRPRHRIPGSLLRFVENCSLSSFKKGKYFSSRASLFADRDILSPPLFILPYSPLPLPSAAGRFFNDGVAWCRNLLSSRRIGFLRRQVGDGPTLKHDSRLSSGFPPSRISLRIAQSFEIRNDKFATRFTQVCFSKISTRVESEELLRTVVQKIYFSKVIIISYKIIHILFIAR